jgi:hypothetical protein
MGSVRFRFAAPLCRRLLLLLLLLLLFLGMRVRRDTGDRHARQIHEKPVANQWLHYSNNILLLFLLLLLPVYVLCVKKNSIVNLCIYVRGGYRMPMTLPLTKIILVAPGSAATIEE